MRAPAKAAGWHALLVWRNQGPEDGNFILKQVPESEDRGFFQYKDEAFLFLVQEIPLWTYI